MKKINVVDSLMGTGKTNFAIKTINENPEKRFIYITPYLDEIKRVKSSTENFNKLYEPQYKGTNKNDNLHQLLKDGKNICSTHALFKKANNITREALKANKYILILDEVMDVVEELNNFTRDDFSSLIGELDLAYVEDDFLIWREDKLDYNGRYNDIKEMSLNKNLVCINEKLLYWNFPVDIFAYFDEVYILTYLFDAQLQKYYYEFFNVKYDKFQVENGMLVNYSKTRERDKVKEISKLINICEDEKLNAIGNGKYNMSMQWYKKDDGTLQGILARNLGNWFNNLNRNHKAEARLWTTFNDFKNNLKGKGYTRNFISINSRATNDYKDTNVLAYTVNRYVKPTLLHFFSKRNISVNQEQYALSEMLQWIWRSRIRENKSIDIYIPSKRMRDLLKKYISEE